MITINTIYLWLNMQQNFYFNYKYVYFCRSKNCLNKKIFKILSRTNIISEPKWINPKHILNACTSIWMYEVQARASGLFKCFQRNGRYSQLVATGMLTVANLTEFALTCRWNKRLLIRIWNIDVFGLIRLYKK